MHSMVLFCQKINQHSEINLRFPTTPQQKLGTTKIEDINFDIYSRHELVPILMALQHLYVHCPDQLESILQLVYKDVRPHQNSHLGRIGMNCWESLVLAAVRLGCNMNFDGLADLATNHRKLRQMMMLSDWEEKRYSRSAIHDNFTLLSPETIRAITAIVVEIGHGLGSKPLERVRADSFVVKKNIHYPTDTNLLYDGCRKIIELTKKIAVEFDIPGWRKNNFWKYTIKSSLRKITKIARSRAANRDQRLKEMYFYIIGQAQQLISKADGSLAILNEKVQSGEILLPKWQEVVSELQYFIAGTEHVIELAQRRVFNDEKIPNPEKVFSLFEPDTELINRGKSPNPIEFGHRVLIVQDNAGFIIHDEVLGQGFTDEKVIADVMKRLQERFKGQIRAASFDKGFWTPNNLRDLSEFIPIVALPKKGRRSREDQKRESNEEFGKIRKWHAGVESAIHALQAGNGLDLCRDKGAAGYQRYVAAAALGRNLQVLGTILLKKERKKRRKESDVLDILLP